MDIRELPRILFSEFSEATVDLNEAQKADGYVRLGRTFRNLGLAIRRLSETQNVVELQILPHFKGGYEPLARIECGAIPTGGGGTRGRTMGEIVNVQFSRGFSLAAPYATFVLRLLNRTAELLQNGSFEMSRSAFDEMKL